MGRNTGQLLRERMILTKEPNQKSLEIGCGSHKIFHDSIGLDKSPHSKADIIRDITRGLPFSDNTFDLVIAIEVIEHIEPYVDLIFLFNEVYRVLVNTGKFIFTTPNGLHSFEHITHHRMFTPNSFHYFKKQEGDFEDMRLSDGIITDFRIDWGNNTEQQLEGIFTAIKGDK